MQGAASILVELDDERVALEELRTPGMWMLASDNVPELEAAKAYELATIREMLEALNIVAE